MQYEEEQEVSKEQSICFHKPPLKHEDQISLLSSGVHFQTSPFVQSTLI